MKKSILAILFGLCLVVYGLLIFDVRFTPAKASLSQTLDATAVSEDSQIIISDGATSIALFAPSGALFETQNEGAAGAAEFLAQDPMADGASLLPEGFTEGARAARYVEGESGEAHYFYQQNIDGIPIYGVQLAVHQRNNQIYSLSGNISNDSHVFTGPLTQEQARSIAIEAAGKETSASLKVASAEKVIFNGKALGISEDAGNYLSWAVVVESTTPAIAYAKKFVVDTTSGEILFEEEITHHVVNRTIFNCNNSTNCVKGRNEGEAAINVAHVDQVYDVFGKYYSFFADNFQRDSFDNQGSAMVGYVDYFDQTCPNAWMNRSKVYLCGGLVATDVASHEMTHAMNQSGAKFVYSNQSGAIDESLADIFASAIDGNFTMGETTELGIIRSMEDPGKYGQPDRLFSPNYWCKSQDYGGVHANGGIISKAFILMSKGGAFNTCTITPIGLDKAYAIFYKASSSYMRQSTNFKDAYNALIQACGDLYGGVDSDTCIQARNSMRATEMDQQTDGTQQGPKCTGQQAKQPDCSAGPGPNPNATATPATNPTVKPGTTVTPGPGTTQNASLNLTLRLQGVFAKPAAANALTVEVNVTGTKLKDPISKKVSFSWLQNGAISGKMDLGTITAGDGYVVSVKAPLHLRRKICDNGPIEISEGKYTCYGQTLTLKGGENTIDAAGILQLAGDIPDDKGQQDNLINSYDVGYVQNNKGKSDSATISRADLNYDGIVDQKDCNIINISSTVKLD